MRKKLLLASLLGLCLAQLLAINAAAAVKAGTTCTKLNQKTNSAGFAYTCIKSGKMMVWSKGVKVVPPTPTPTPEQTSSPSTSTSGQPVLDSDGIAKIADNDVQQILKTSPSPKSSYVVHQSPNVSQALVDIANKVLPTAVKFWQPVYAPTKPADVIMGYWSDGDWLQTTDQQAGDTPGGYSSLGSWISGHPTSDWPSVSGSGSHAGITVSGVTPKIIIIVSGPNVIYRPGAYTTPTHEYTMNVMQELDLNVFGQSPCWFNEGMAQFYGAALTYSDPTTYLANRRTMLLDTEFGKYPFSTQKTDPQWVADMQNSETGDCANNSSAWFGQLAMEKMVAVHGTAGVIAFLKDLNLSKNFATSFQNIYNMTLVEFYGALAPHISSTVNDLLGLGSGQGTNTPAPIAVSQGNAAAMQATILKQVGDAITASQSVPTSPLISLNVQDGALTSSQRQWINSALQFISYLSPPTKNAKWNLVFPSTMDWFLKNWDMNLESQHYKDMFANNTAQQLMGSVHSHGTSDGGWDASFFVSPTNNWFNTDWQLRFITQLLKPIGYADGSLGVKVPDWFARSFAYPISAAYTQITSQASYAQTHQMWLNNLKELPKPFDMTIYEDPNTYTAGYESYKAPGSLADEILLSQAGLSKALGFIGDIAKAGTDWATQLPKTFGITKSDLYALITTLVGG